MLQAALAAIWPSQQTLELSNFRKEPPARVGPPCARRSFPTAAF